MGSRSSKPVHGWLNFYKPRGMTSTQAVGKIRWLFDAQKAGHAGTLDPLAEGVLPIALGEATKTISYMQEDDKSYSFDLIWGEERDTADAEGCVVATSNTRITRAELDKVIPVFTGEVQQAPPRFSAIKIDGERAYNRARAGENFEIKSRLVHIYSLECLSHSGERTTLRTRCGKGTYIRSLGQDIARKSGSYGYIDNLVRESVGSFSTENAFFLDKLENLRHKEAVHEALLPVDAALDDIPVFAVTTSEASRLRQGQHLSFISKADGQRLEMLGFEDVVKLYLDGQCIGLARREGPFLKPQKLFNL